MAVRYSDVEDGLLLGAYQESLDNPEHRATVGEIAEKYQILGPNAWVQQAIKNLVDKSLIAPSGTSGATRRLRLTGEGLRYAENIIDSRRTVAANASGVVEVEPTADPVFQIDVPGEGLTTISSARWTGIQSRLRSRPEVVELIRVRITEIDNLISEAGLSNYDQQKAKAITEALRALISSPEPEWEAVVRLLNAPVLTAALNVAQIIQLTMILIFG